MAQASGVDAVDALSPPPRHLAAVTPIASSETLSGQFDNHQSAYFFALLELLLDPRLDRSDPQIALLPFGCKVQVASPVAGCQQFLQSSMQPSWTVLKRKVEDGTVNRCQSAQDRVRANGRNCNGEINDKSALAELRRLKSGQTAPVDEPRLRMRLPSMLQAKHGSYNGP
jgi:hypothetical protein